MDTLSFVIGHNKGYKQGRAKGGFLSMEENEAGGMTYELAGTKSEGFSLNVAYGEEPPEDTSKLWIKTSEPEYVSVVPQLPDGEITTLDATMLLGVSNAGVATVGSKVYIFGGYYGSFCTSAIGVFDTKTQSYELLDITLPSTVESVAAAAVGTKIYLFGGLAGGMSTQRFDTIDVFDTETQMVMTLEATLQSQLLVLVQR